MTIVLVGHANAVTLTISSYVCAHDMVIDAWPYLFTVSIYEVAEFSGMRSNKQNYLFLKLGRHHEYIFVMITQCLSFNVFCLDYDANAAIEY